MTRKSYEFFGDNLRDTITEQIYDNLSNEVDMEAKYQFDMGDGYTLTVWIDMREYRDYKYYDWDSGYPCTPTSCNTIETYRSIDKVYAECIRDGEGDDDYFEADITNLFDKELRWEVY